MELDGTIIGMIDGGAKSPTTFRTFHAIDCARENEIIAATGSVPRVIRLLDSLSPR